MPRHVLTTTATNIGTGRIIVHSDLPNEFLYTTVATGGTPNAADYVVGNLGGQFDIIQNNHTDRELYARLAHVGIPVTLNVSPG